MVERADQSTLVPAAGQAQVIFMRPSKFGGAIQSAVFDVSSGEPEFIGIVSSGTQISHMVGPGKRVFMVVSEAADFLEADLSEGKTYYAIVTPRMGAWKARFSLYPVRNGGAGEFQYQSSEFQGWLGKMRYVSNTPASTAWFTSNKADIKEKQARNWEVWKQKSPADLAERTLNPEDGL
jgi:hypothetical protein